MAFCEVEDLLMPAAPALFGTDGVRGIAGEPPLQKNFIRRLGAAAAAIYQQEVSDRKAIFLVGRDTRQSGPWIVKAFAEGAASQGVKLWDVGVTSTPSLAYLVPKKQVMGGVMVSASHNPAQFNGIKLFSPLGRKCPDSWERLIEERVQDTTEPAPARAVIKSASGSLKEYLAFLKQTLTRKASLKGLTLVVDCSHGSLSKIAPAFLRRLGVRVIPIGASPNGKNINAGWGSQHPDRMRDMVLKKKAHGGMAFDGDADRIVLCDENGRILDGDYIIAAAAHFLKRENRLAGDRVVVTVMANLGLMKALRSWGIDPLVTPVGDRFVSEKLEECGGVLGGEQSGHIIFHHLLPTGDGLLTGLQLLHFLCQYEKPLSWIGGLFPKFPQVLQNLHVDVKMPLDACPGVQAAIQEAISELGDDGRVLVRYSGTEPLLRIMMEGPDEGRLRALCGHIEGEARKALCRGSN